MKVSIATLIVLAHTYGSAVISAQEDGGWANVVGVGQRPYYLIDQMKPSSVKDKLGMSRH